MYACARMYALRKRVNACMHACLRAEVTPTLRVITLRDGVTPTLRVITLREGVTPTLRVTCWGPKPAHLQGTLLCLPPSTLACLPSLNGQLSFVRSDKDNKQISFVFEKQILISNLGPRNHRRSQSWPTRNQPEPVCL